MDLPAEELGRAFIINDNEFHTTLYELAGKRTVMDFLTGVSSQYERFRTFLNLGDRDNLLRLYNDHIKIWSCISSRDYEGLSDVVSITSTTASMQAPRSSPGIRTISVRFTRIF